MQNIKYLKAFPPGISSFYIVSASIRYFNTGISSPDFSLLLPDDDFHFPPVIFQYVPGLTVQDLAQGFKR